MDSDWQEVTRTVVGSSPTAPTPLTTFAFDTEQELLWTGNEYVSNSFRYLAFTSV